MDGNKRGFLATLSGRQGSAGQEHRERKTAPGSLREKEVLRKGPLVVDPLRRTSFSRSDPGAVLRSRCSCPAEPCLPESVARKPRLFPSIQPVARERHPTAVIALKLWAPLARQSLVRSKVRTYSKERRYGELGKKTLLGEISGTNPPEVGLWQREPTLGVPKLPFVLRPPALLLSCSCAISAALWRAERNRPGTLTGRAARGNH